MTDTQPAPANGALPTPPIVEVLGVSKRFGLNQALSDVSMRVTAGDSRALVGRNGAGKSTLVGVLTGIIAPDAGRVRFAGTDAPGLAERQKWRDRVACVYQKSTLVPTLTVAENLLLNAQPTGGLGWIRWGAARREAERVLAGWGMDLDVEQECARLSVEQRQIVEIARALIQGTRFIILDEPTAELEGREVRRLFDRINHLQAAGVTFLYISHYLEEIYEVCRSVTVLRDGRVVAEAPLEAMPKGRVVAAMVGDQARMAGEPRRAEPGFAATSRPAPALELRDLHLGAVVFGVSLQVAAGECVGLAGLAGSGKGEIGDAIAGLLPPSGGAIRIAGNDLRGGDVVDAQRKGVGYVPRDRHARGIVPLLSVAENITMTITERLGHAGVILPSRQADAALRMIRSLQIVAASTEQPVKELSGGNQQKAVMARALASDPKVLVLLYPTQGVDIASKEALFAIVERARAGGTAVLIISDELDELSVCDRVLVIFKGRLTTEFAAGWESEALVAAIEELDMPSEQADAVPDRPATRRTRATFLGLRELTLVPVIILVIVIGAFASDAFLTRDNFLNILQQSSELSVVVIAETLILLAGKFDLSLESVVGLAPMLGAWLIIKDVQIGGSGVGLQWWLAIPVVLVTGALVGLVNGFLIVKLRLNAFIVTLAMLILLRGVQLGTTNGKTLFDLPDEYLYLGSGKWAGIPVSIWIAGILYVVFGLFLRYHRIGRALYAIGGNADAARVAGIRVERVLWGTLIVGGMLAALAGLMLTGRIASVVTSQGQNMIFYVFAAAVIGGISLNGGKGRLLGALTGVLLLGILQNVLTLAEIPAFWIDAVYGAIILLALVLGRVAGAAAEET